MNCSSLSILWLKCACAFTRIYAFCYAMVYFTIFSIFRSYCSWVGVCVCLAVFVRSPFIFLRLLFGLLYFVFFWWESQNENIPFTRHCYWHFVNLYSGCLFVCYFDICNVDDDDDEFRCSYKMGECKCFVAVCCVVLCVVWYGMMWFSSAPHPHSLLFQIILNSID